MSICPPSHPHSHWCYRSHKCRCKFCKGWPKRQSTERHSDLEKLGMTKHIDSEPYMLMLRALGWMGWSCKDIGEGVGIHEQPLNQLRNGKRKRIHRDTARLVWDFFNRHSIKEPPGTYPEITRAYSRGKGWPSPMAIEVPPRP